MSCWESSEHLGTAPEVPPERCPRAWSCWESSHVSLSTVYSCTIDAALAPTPATEWTACCPVGTATIREPACWPGPYPKDDLQSPGELEVMINCQAIALNQERKPRTNDREPHVAPRHYGRNLANTYVHSRVCYLPPLCPTALYHAMLWYIPSMRTRVPTFGQTFPNKVGPCQKKGKRAKLRSSCSKL